MNYKPKLTETELISHMKAKGITFNEINEQQAKHVLVHKNYYFKLTAYRKNFTKRNGKYQNLDFAYLVDLASIDMQLREYLLSLSLDIEHSIKVKILALITNDSTEDGYSIIKDFKQYNESAYKNTVKYLKNNRYMNDFYNKHHDHISIWALLEVMTFGALSYFVDFYYQRTKYKSVKKIKNYFKYTKNIRNACAHSNPLLVNLFSEKELVPKPTAQVTTAATLMGIPKSELHDMKVNDLTSLFFLHSYVKDGSVGKRRAQQGNALIKRFNRHSEWYESVSSIKKIKKILTKLIDYLEKH
ncbi:Abi family protein [Fructilactobacillus carniphilus]|uniref:Abi family protein n=1 Tax=Fructilactobacillus carniphilus TaxID=2940297 RepID=A0ABY5BWD8_9LACO|nr:Abi family protein [Fructilactobacillus carniphilus]USS90816.1 Abi family protein [Fructilactobacillus carniphilus]